MGKWIEVTVEDSCIICDDKRFPLSSIERKDMKGEYPYYGANGIVDYIDKYRIDGNYILIAEDGGNFESYKTRPIAYRISGKGWVNNHAHVLQSNIGYNQDYIFYSLEHKNVLPYIAGGTRSKLNQLELKKIKIYAPKHYKEQEKIAEVLGELDKAIDSTKKLIDKYTLIKEGMLQDLLTNGIDENGKIRSEATHKYKDSPLGRIPVEWECILLETLCSVKSSKRIHFSDYIERGTPFYRSKEIIDLSLGKEIQTELFIKDDLYAQLEKRYGVPMEKDILITAVGTLGICYQVKEKEKFYFKDGNLIWLSDLIANSSILIKFLPKLLKKQFEFIAIGSSQKAYTIEKLKKLYVYKINNLKEVNKIEQSLDSIVNIIDKEQQYLSKLQLKKQALMQDLLNNKVSVDCLL